MSKRCVGCMKTKNNSPICEHCGYNENIPNYPHQLPIGTVLKDQYVVGKVLGQGGFGITYIGWDNTLDAAVAIKEYYPGSFVNRDCNQTLLVTCNGESAENLFRHNRDRFVQEAKILAKLSNVPGIVRIHSLFEENNTAYIVMDYIQGIDLKRYIRMQGRVLTTEETFSVIRPVMYALSKVHEAELVHRDISPDNIMIQNDGSIKLLDFGAAREVIGAEVDKELPQSTEAIIKHGFAPMEQYRRRGSLGPWTDVYSLCATMYYCLTGKVPNSAPERIMGDDNVNWKQIPGLSPEQIATLEKGLALMPENRISSMRELWQGLFGQSRSTFTGVFQNKTEAGKEIQSAQLSDKKTTEFTSQTLPLEVSMSPAPSMQLQKDKSSPKKIIIGILSAVVFVAIVSAGWFLTHPEKESMPTTIPETIEAGSDIPIIEEYPSITTATSPTVAATVFEEPLWKNNVLMDDSTYTEDSNIFWNEKYQGYTHEIYDFFSSRPIFNSKIPRIRVTDVYFLDTLADAPTDAWDVSADQNGNVLAWTVKNNKNALDLYIAGEGGVNGSLACRTLFSGYTELSSIHFNNSFFTDDVTDMSAMFEYCKKLPSLDLSSFDTSNVRNMSYLFANCDALTSLNLSKLNTSNVITMSGMFSGCRKLPSIDLSSFDTSHVVDMSYMFNSCESITELNLSKFNTSNVVNMSGMFSNCCNEKMTALDVRCFNTAQVIYMNSMFSNCLWVTELDLSSFDTSNVIDMSYMFSHCRRLISLNISSFDTYNVTDMHHMFEMCSLLPALDLLHFNTYNVKDLSGMFYGCGYLKELDVNHFDLSNVRYMDHVFYGCDKLPIENKRINDRYIW